MPIVSLFGRENEPAVLELLAMAQIHRPADEASKFSHAIADEYAGSSSLQLWGCEYQGRIVGILGAETLDGGRRVILDLAVMPEARRKGVGRALLGFLQSDGGVTSLEGDTLPAAEAFYVNCGLHVRREGSMPSGEPRLRFAWTR